MANSYIIYSLKTGGAIMLKTETFLSMTDADFHNLDTGDVAGYTKSSLINEEDFSSISENFSKSDELELEGLINSELFELPNLGDDIFINFDEDFNL